MNGCKFHRGLLLVVASVLAGCGGVNQDLHAWIEGVKQSEKPKVDPLPILKPYEQFIYQASRFRDPFENLLKQQQEEQAKSGRAQPGGSEAPDLNRRKEPLESFPIDALKMIGTLADESATWAIIQAPDQAVSRVVVGNYMGQHHGKITRVDNAEVLVTEVIQDGTGGWIQNEVVVPLTEVEQK